jgi:NAD(P)-dependent dehydrogenase (short-subunit alcohol dehydrogenase family)
MNRAIIVAGGLGVLGRAVMEILTARGHAVAVLDRRLETSGDRSAVPLFPVDLDDEAAVHGAYVAAAKRIGPITGLVNAVGGFVWEPVLSGHAETWDDMYRVNLRTVVISCRAALPFLLKHGGAIVNVGAARATNPDAGVAAYAASKAGVRALTESLADEVRSNSVRVNAVLPTIIDTPRNGVPRPRKVSWTPSLIQAGHAHVCSRVHAQKSGLSHAPPRAPFLL